MKKLLMIVAVACAALCTSCTTVADRAKGYAEDMMDAYYEDKARMKTLSAEIVEYTNILSGEDKSEFIAEFDKTAADADFNDMFLAVNALYFISSLEANADNAQALTPIFENINEYRKTLADDYQFQYFLDYFLGEDGYSYEELLVKSVNGCGCGAAHSAESAQ
jgi:hypothetical protein